MAFLAFEKKKPEFEVMFSEPNKPDHAIETRSDTRKILIMPGHYKKILPAQQPIRARVLL